MRYRTIPLGEKVKWLILLRLLMTTIFFVVGNLVYEVSRINFYHLIATIYGISILYSVWLATGRLLKVLVIVQLVIDVFLETFVIVSTGMTESIFTGLYILTILSAHLIVSANAGFVFTLVIACIYGGVAIGGFFGVVPGLTVSARGIDLDVLLYTTYVHIATFFLVTVLVGYLLRRLTHVEHLIKIKEHLAVVGEAASEIAHEIRNPLAAMSGSVELLHEQMHQTATVEQKELMMAILKESERISSVFDQFLDYAKAARVVKAEIVLGELLHEIVCLYENNSRTRHVVFVRDFERDRGLCRCDAVRIKQVLFNIMQNAIDELDAGGTVTVRLEEQSDRIAIVIEDTGKGIAPRAIKDIFKPKPSHKKKGFGVGLSIAYKIVEQHGGYIDVESARNVGTIFRVVLPVQTERIVHE